jgi:uncharacterized protein YbjT (DUF2867 family)
MILRVSAMDSLTAPAFNADMNTQQNILVLGGTGKTGRRIVERLAALGVPTRVGSRSAEPPFDWEDRTTWWPALEGVSAVYISYFPDLAIEGAADKVAAFARLAVETGVRRLVLLSGRGEEEAERAEELVRASGADWTILRATWFSQNFAENYFVDGVLDGVLALPADDVPEPFVDADDIADAAVAAFTEPGHVGELYELTGPRLLTFAEAVQEIAAATGRDLRYQPISIDEFTSEMAKQDVQDDIVELLAYLFSEVLDGRNAHVTDGVQRALGRPPRDFGAYVRETAATGVWNP